MFIPSQEEGKCVLGGLMSLYICNNLYGIYAITSSDIYGHYIILNLEQTTKILGQVS